jgi:HEAT repeat protein
MARVAQFALLILFALPLAAQDEKPDFDQLWDTGSLWEVGDNREKVRVARKAIVDAGEEGRKYALTRLAVSDSLQIRCLNEVFSQWGAAAYDDLVANIAHADKQARRNVAELLAALNDSRAGEALLAQAAKEIEISPRLSQLAALAKWKVEGAIPLIAEISCDKADRIRHRAAGLLGGYDSKAAIDRLIEMLDDDIYYVRDGAAAALAASSQAARTLCVSHVREQLESAPAQQNTQRIRLLLPVIATCAEAGVPKLLQRALKHEVGAVRGEAANALVTWKLGAGLQDTEVDVESELTKAADAEYDPYAKSAIEKARTLLADGGKK